jgi:hypothetical protein
MRNSRLPKDTDLLGALPALRRAARSALRLAIQTGTPCYVLRAGKIVNIGAKRPAAAVRQAQPSARKADAFLMAHDHKVVRIKSPRRKSRLSGKNKRAGA